MNLLEVWTGCIFSFYFSATFLFFFFFLFLIYFVVHGLIGLIGGTHWSLMGIFKKKKLREFHCLGVLLNASELGVFGSCPLAHHKHFFVDTTVLYLLDILLSQTPISGRKFAFYNALCFELGIKSIKASCFSIAVWLYFCFSLYFFFFSAPIDL